MGEFAEYQGDRIKIGTCEDMYYLRADQRHLISGYQFAEIDRFRFPFPDEDDVEPGCFGDHDRGIEIPNGFTLEPGYFDHRDGCTETRVQLMQQALRREDDDSPQLLASIVGCVGCGHKGWLVPKVARKAIVCFRLAGEHEIADRMEAGYQLHSVAA